MSNETNSSQVSLPNDPGYLRFIGESKPIPLKVSHWISLSQLEATQSIRTLFGILLAKVIRYSKTKTGPKDRSIYSRVSQSTKDGNNFDRTMILMCLNSAVGANTMIVTLDARKSDEIFGQCLEACDRQGGFGPGAIVAIRGPEMITTYFGDKNGLPVLNFSGGMKLVDQAKSKISIGNIPSDTVTYRLQAFHYTNVTLTLTNMNVSHTNCCGNLCDSIDMKGADGSWKSQCPCFSVTKALGSVVFDLNFTAKTGVPGEMFEVKRFTSRMFTGMVTKNGIPSSINVAQLERSGADLNIAKKLDDLIETINKDGGFNVLGWVRIGRMSDPTANDGTPGATKSTILSSHMIRHVTQVKPNVNETAIRGLVIDIEGILAKSQIVAGPEGGNPSTDVPPAEVHPSVTETQETPVGKTPQELEE